MSKAINIIIILLVIILSANIIYYIFNSHMSTKITVNNPTMLIMYTDKNRITHYLAYDLINKNTKEIYNHINRVFPAGSLSPDKKYLYYTERTPEPIYHLYKLDIHNSEKVVQEITIPDFNMDFIEVNRNKIYMRGLQLDDPNRRNFNIGVYDLNSNQMNIWNKEETDKSIFAFDYNPNTLKLYGVERSEKEVRSTQLPDRPTHKIVEFDKNGKRIRELDEINMSITDISVSKDGDTGLFTEASSTPYPSIYMIDFKTSTVTPVIEYDKKSIVKCPIYSPDEKGFYYLAITPDSKQITSDTGEKAWTRGVYYYDFATKTSTKIFMKDDAIVRNFTIYF